jgi:hypothetical protein
MSIDTIPGMSLIRIYQGKSKPKRKPGWQKAEAEHAAWLARVQSTTLFNPHAKPKMQAAKTKIDPVVRAPVVSPNRLQRGHSLGTFGGTAGKPVARPDILYKEDPELLARELKARERKFNVAPAYNKGGDVFVTEEELVKQLSGNKRRP